MSGFIDDFMFAPQEDKALVSDKCKTNKRALFVRQRYGAAERRQSALTAMLTGKRSVFRPRAYTIEPLDENDPDFYMISVLAHGRTLRDRCK